MQKYKIRICSSVFMLCLLGCPLVACAEEGAPAPSGDLTKADALRQSAKYQESAEIYRQVLQANPSERAAKRGLAEALGGLGRWDEAEKVNAEILDEKASWEDHERQAQLFLNSGKLKGARTELEKVLEMRPELFFPRVELCSLYVRSGEYEKCKPYLAGYEPAQVEDSDFCMLRAMYFMKKRDFEKADPWIKRALELSGPQQEIMSTQYMNDMNLGRIVIDEVRRMEGGVKSSLVEHYRKAAMLMESGNVLQAKAKIQWLMNYYPEDQDLKLMMAVIEGEVGNLDESIKQLEDITHIKSDKVSAANAAQEMIKEYVRQREFEEQVKARDWEEALHTETRYFDVYDNIGPPYREQFIGELDGYVEKILAIQAPLFDSPPEFKGRSLIKIYADKKSFVREAYDYFFSDAVFFAGVYTTELNAIFYHFNKDLKGGGIVHELGHFVLHQRGGNIPLWLDEGLADYGSMKFTGLDLLEKRLEGKHFMDQLYRWGRLPDLDVIVKTREYSPRSYILWRNAVQFIFEAEDGKYLP
ncbi:MAG: tetratricopeptide repeat protein, partial [Candidatus Omnitrophota bacterium]